MTSLWNASNGSWSVSLRRSSSPRSEDTTPRPILDTGERVWATGTPVSKRTPATVDAKQPRCGVLCYLRVWELQHLVRVGLLMRFLFPFPSRIKLRIQRVPLFTLDGSKMTRLIVLPLRVSSPGRAGKTRYGCA